MCVKEIIKEGLISRKKTQDATVTINSGGLDIVKMFDMSTRTMLEF